jgi:hypothetical protein
MLAVISAQSTTPRNALIMLEIGNTHPRCAHILTTVRPGCAAAPVGRTSGSVDRPSSPSGVARSNTGRPAVCEGVDQASSVLHWHGILCCLKVSSKVQRIMDSIASYVRTIPPTPSRSRTQETLGDRITPQLNSLLPAQQHGGVTCLMEVE